MESQWLDPDTWTDGPVEEDTPMNTSYQGNAIFVIEVTYHQVFFPQKPMVV